jgi:uncharacterized protein YbjQ (UPF0145 family)
MNQIQFDCPGCGQTIVAPEEAQFERVKCPTCQHEFFPDKTRLVRPAPAALAAPPPIGQSQTIIATTGNEISGRIIESYIGIARGVVVRSPGLEQQLFGGLKKIVGGNIESFAKVCETARTEAFSRMMKQAKTMNADAIIAMRYDATEFAPGITEVLAYGTAVKLAGADAVQLRTAQQPLLPPKDPPTDDTQSRL